uniref:Uncharacterized protein n=1 Tax=Phaeomonas parva TaxID=124430 RepID=A0A7S1TRS6_9STRA|mmetsp:Transcript_14046/g.41928  ORF Transcript_14046/g.41928 Transcript_14046/m.41928 type:complete len:208 (+) Transcript_14046:151-774(+)|eukprot:CAMPEP_0118853308 /NCGR_PEP_ID=MMETSP1163-20130328/1952_1 /TAXON_ID=124430 /ORGANISM="Phaeomonas parva, Strain CCMP2877" /LENGTH=207 /DNA_ID=CAMNT_0006785849 /DNA_START=143 /DNA_END=766 /DNA_ORIENTATION=-
MAWALRLLGVALATVAVDGFRPLMMNAAPKASLDRRAMLQGVTSAAAAVLALGVQSPARAASSLLTPNEETRLRKGYNNLNYLLDNWDKETMKCNKAGGCVRTPDNIRVYLGMRSIEDPLFNVEKIFLRVGAEVESEEQGDALEAALNEWSRHSEQASVMAYTSSWGEANPGGGELQVNRFAKKAQDECIMARDALKVLVDVCGVSL